MQDATALSDERLDDFQRVGGRWVAVLLAQLGYPPSHDPAVTRNLAVIDSLRSRCEARKLACGVWANGWAGGVQGTTAEEDAATVAALVHSHDLGPVVLDCEEAYHFPGGDPAALPRLLWAVRKLIPTRSVLVSTNEPNDSMIWNGGSIAQGLPGPKGACFPLGVRMAPQWYFTSPHYPDSPWLDPVRTMAWLQQNGNVDNFFYAGGPDHRAVPLSWVHGTLEATGVEGSDLAAGLARMIEAKQHGLQPGMSVYTLEAMPDDDLPRLAAARGKLFYL